MNATTCFESRVCDDVLSGVRCYNRSVTALCLRGAIHEVIPCAENQWCVSWWGWGCTITPSQFVVCMWLLALFLGVLLVWDCCKPLINIYIHRDKEGLVSVQNDMDEFSGTLVEMEQRLSDAEKALSSCEEEMKDQLLSDGEDAGSEPVKE